MSFRQPAVLPILSINMRNDLSRRDFVAQSALLLAAGSGVSHAAGSHVVETDVDIATRDGRCDAAFFYPSSGAHPGVIIWTDVFGLRPAYREFGRRLASLGYTVLVPNPFYRTQKAPVFDDVSTFNFQSDADRAKLPPLTGPLNQPGAAESDAVAYVNFLGSAKAGKYFEETRRSRLLHGRTADAQNRCRCP